MTNKIYHESQKFINDELKKVWRFTKIKGIDIKWMDQTKAKYAIILKF